MASLAKIRKRDPYKVLGVSRNDSEDEIKKAFRRQAREYHPDVNHDKSAELRFKELNEAYEVLGDPQKRREYNWKHPEPIEEQYDEYHPWTGVQEDFGGPGWYDPFSANTRRSYPWQDQQWVGPTAESQMIVIPDTDAGLLAAFVEAWNSPVSKFWEVRMPPDGHSLGRVQTRIPYKVSVDVNEFDPRSREIKVFVDPRYWQTDVELDRDIFIMDRFQPQNIFIPRGEFVNPQQIWQMGAELTGVTRMPRWGWPAYIEGLKTVAYHISGAEKQDVFKQQSLQEATQAIFEHRTHNRVFYSGVDMGYFALFNDPTIDVTRTRLRDIASQRLREHSFATPEGRPAPRGSRA